MCFLGSSLVQPNDIFHMIDQLISIPLVLLFPNRFYGNLGAKVPSDA